MSGLMNDVRVTGRRLLKTPGFTLALTLLTTLAAGLVPAFRSASVDPSVDLRDEVDETTAKARALGRFVDGIEARPSVARAAVTTAIPGVVPDVRYEEFGEETREVRRALYVPHARLGWRSASVMARTTGPAEPLVPELRSMAREAYPGLAVSDVRTMAQVRETTTWGERFLARIMGFFALLAMLPVGMGLYALLRQFVGARTHEIGVRRALGASGGAIGALVLSRAGLVTWLGSSPGGAPFSARGEGSRRAAFRGGANERPHAGRGLGGDPPAGPGLLMDSRSPGGFG